MECVTARYHICVREWSAVYFSYTGFDGGYCWHPPCGFVSFYLSCAVRYYVSLAYSTVVSAEQCATSIQMDFSNNNLMGFAATSLLFDCVEKRRSWVHPYSETLRVTMYGICSSINRIVKITFNKSIQAHDNWNIFKLICWIIFVRRRIDSKEYFIKFLASFFFIPLYISWL